MPASETAPRYDITHWPRLTRFYGLGPGALSRLPRVVLQVYIDQLPVLEAEEQLARFQAADMPHLEQKDRERTHRQLTRMADLEPPAQSITISKDADGNIQVGGIGGLGGIKVVTG